MFRHIELLKIDCGLKQNLFNIDNLESMVHCPYSFEYKYIRIVIKNNNNALN